MNRRPSPLDNEQCRQCSSFSDYVKITHKKPKDNSVNKADKKDKCNKDKPDKPISLEERRTDCPLDKDELGRSSWGLLHTMAAKYPEKPTRQEQKDMTEFFTLFGKFYPCEHCAKDFRDDIKNDPPKVESNEALSQWLCRMHNKVNKKINKEEFDCSKVNERWRDGWLDGSCDFF